MHGDNKSGEFKIVLGAEFTTTKAATDRQFVYPAECAESDSGEAVVVVTETGSLLVVITMLLTETMS